MSSERFRPATLACGVLLLCVAAGCGTQDYGAQVTLPVSSSDREQWAEERIRQIRNNPAMPEQAKAIAIGQIRQQTKALAASPPAR